MNKSFVWSGFTLTLWWIFAVKKLRSSHGCGDISLHSSSQGEGSFKLRRVFLSDELPLNEDFFKIGISEGKSERGHFFGKNWNERQSDNLSGMENKDKRNARLSLGLSRIVIWQSLLSPSCEQRQQVRPAERTKRYKARNSVESRSRTQRGRWGRMSTMTSLQSQISIAGLGQR